MKKLTRLWKLTVSAAIGMLFAVGAQAQTSRVPPVRTIATLGTCDTFKLVGVTDGTSGATCSSGGGTTDVLCLCADGTWTPIPTSSSSGTVSSVALAVPAEWSVSGSPITTSGTITIAEATQTANTVYAGPTTGGSAAPGFRSLVSADIPNNAANTSGNAGTATALAANGGNCSAGSYPLGVDAAGAVESCTAVTADPTLAGDVDGLSSANDIDEAAVESELESVLDLQDLQGAVTDFQVPNNITVSLAATATALAANGANCSAGQYPLGVDASGAVESCTAAPTATGDVVGPASSTDEAIARYDSTTGKLLQNSGVFLTDANKFGNANGGATFTSGGLSVFESLSSGNGGFLYSGQVIANAHLASTVIGMDTSGLRIGSALSVRWSDNTDYNGTADVLLSRHAAKVLKIDDALKLDPLASPPVTCDAAAEGGLYSDTSHALCFCDGTTWLVVIGAGSCA